MTDYAMDVPGLLDPRRSAPQLREWALQHTDALGAQESAAPPQATEEPAGGHEPAAGDAGAGDDTADVGGRLPGGDPPGSGFPGGGGAGGDPPESGPPGGGASGGDPPGSGPPGGGDDAGWAEPPPPPPGGFRRLLRSRDDRMLAGVAGGLGRYFDVDPIIFRLAFAVLTLVGGIGLVAYLAAWLFVPEDDGSGRPAPAQRSRAFVIVAGIALAIAAFAILDSGPWWLFWAIVPDSPFGWLLLAIGLIVLAVATAGSARLGGGGRAGRLRALSPRRRVALVVGWLVVVAVGAVAAVASAWAGAAGWGAIVAVVVILLGVGMIGAAFVGGASWLAIPAILLAVPVGVVSAAGIEFEGGYGDRTYRPATVAAIPADGYELAAGELVVDLRALDLPRDRPVDVDVRLGAGQAIVLVPDDACVGVDAHVEAGAIDVGGRHEGGLNYDRREIATAASGPRVRVSADVGLGVIRVGATDEDVAAGKGHRDRDLFGDREAERQEAACATR